jgi:hypothetical protein
LVEMTLEMHDFSSRSATASLFRARWLSTARTSVAPWSRYDYAALINVMAERVMSS